MASGSNPGSVLSQFDLSDYSRNGQVRTLQRQLGSAAADRYSYGYDAGDQLRSATRKVVGTGATDRRFSYDYDRAWNRTSEQRESVLSAYHNNGVNQLTSRDGGGKLLVAGSTNEAAKVKVQNQPVATDANNSFSTLIDANVGTTTITISATDYSPNANTTTPPRQWTVSSTAGATTNYGYDNNGNLLGDGTKSYDWDQENRLIKITIGANVTEFVYDGQSRRVAEKLNGSVIRRWVWAGLKMVEERDAAGTTVTRRFYPLGEQWVGGANAGNYFYTRDHLGSIRELTNASAVVQARYDYDPYGRVTKLSGSLDASFLYTGHFYHQGSQLTLAPYRAYDAEIGRWISRDPLAERGGINLYAYCNNSPVVYRDPDGRNPLLITAGAGAVIGGIYGGITGGLTGGWTGALSGALGGAATGGLIGLGVNPIIAGAAGGALSSLANQGLNGEDPRCPSSIAKTVIGTVTGGIGGGVGARLPEGLASELFTGAGVGASGAAGETVVNAVSGLNNAVNAINNNQQQQIDQILNQQ